MPGVEKRIARECLGVRVRMLNRVVSRVYDDALRPHGVKVSQMNVLVALAAAGPQRAVDLGRILHLEKSTLSRNLPRMEAQGWIDASGERVRVTPKGSALLGRLVPAWERAQERVRRLLGPDGARALEGMLDRVRRDK
jgi:DNA-binding MarR family transcriptional regulator